MFVNILCSFFLANHWLRFFFPLLHIILDCIEEDLKRARVTKFKKTFGRLGITLCDIAEDREQWRELVATFLPGRTAALTKSVSLH